MTTIFLDQNTETIQMFSFHLIVSIGKYIIHLILALDIYQKYKMSHLYIKKIIMLLHIFPM